MHEALSNHVFPGLNFSLLLSIGFYRTSFPGPRFPGTFRVSRQGVIKCWSLPLMTHLPSRISSRVRVRIPSIHAQFTKTPRPVRTIDLHPYYRYLVPVSLYLSRGYFVPAHTYILSPIASKPSPTLHLSDLSSGPQYQSKQVICQE